METDLHRIIYSTQPLSIDHVQYFVYQLLRGLKYIHSANVLHRDLKPSNLLVNSNCDLKICDFGLARHMEDEWSGTRTEYVVTRWYRAPEIMLACTEYSKAIDVWSAGCIFAELLARQPMFPGSDYIAQLRLIHGKLGRPSEQELDFITSERAKRFMLSLSAKPPTDMATLFPQYRGETEALDLLAKMLTFLPSKRISVEDALAHPFMASLHNPDDEPSLNYTFSFPFENEDLSREKIQDLIWHEIRELHPEMSENPPSGGSRLKSSSRLDADSKADSKSEEADEKKRSHSGDDDSKASRKRSISPDPGYK
jgi:serine/threonine protein kinase